MPYPGVQGFSPFPTLFSGMNEALQGQCSKQIVHCDTLSSHGGVGVNLGVGAVDESGAAMLSQ